MAALIPLRWVLAQKVCPCPRNQSASETAELIRLSSSWSHRTIRFLTPSKAIGKAEIAIAEVAEEEEMVDRHRAEPLAAWLTPFARSALGERIARHSHEKESIGRRHPLVSGAARSVCCPAPGRVPSHARSAGIESAAGRAHYIGVSN